MPGTRAAPRCCEAAIELPLAKHRYSELLAAYTRLEQDNTYLRSELSKVTERKKVLSAALSEKTGAVSYMTPESSMWSKEVDALVLMLGRWDVENAVEITARALYRMRDGEGDRLGLQLAELTGGLYDKMLARIRHDHEIVIADHLREQVFKPVKGLIYRLNTITSVNHIRWLDSIFKWDWSGLDAEGNPTKVRQTLSPGSKVPVPMPFDLKLMAELQDTTLAGEAGNVAHADGKGADVRDVHHTLRNVQARVDGSTQGGWATQGTQEDPDTIVLTGDGGGITADDSLVRVVVFAGSVKKMNQSTHGIHNLTAYRRSHHAEAWHTLQGALAGTRPALCQLYRERRVRSASGVPSGRFVRLILSADKPFLCHVLGRRDHTFEYFSPYCPCTRTNLYNYSFDDKHYDEFTFEHRCSLGLVPLWEALCEPEPDAWTVTDPVTKKVRQEPPRTPLRIEIRSLRGMPCTPQTYSKAEVLALRAKVDAMSEKDQEKWHDEWSRAHFGQWFGRYPLLPYDYVVYDELHLAINQFNAITEEAFNSHLSREDGPKELQETLAKLRAELNALVQGAGIMLTYGEKGKTSAANGPKLKKMMRAANVLKQAVELMKPYYDLMEAEAHESVRHPSMTNAEANELRETSKGAGAALAAAAPAAPKRKVGQKKEKTGFAKKKKKSKAAPTMDARRPLIQPVAEDPEEEEEEEEGGGELFCPQVGQPHTAPEGAKYESYYSRVCKMFYTFCERWTFIHQNDLELIDVDLRKARGKEAKMLGLAVATATIDCVGTKRQLTYLHDIYYGVQKLYEVLGKPYLASTEGNEHAHQEGKMAFKRCISHSCKRRCDSLQLMDFHHARRNVNSIGASELPRNSDTTRYTGIATQSSYKQRARVDTDLAIEDTKAGILELLRVEGQETEMHRAPVGLLDPNWVKAGGGGKYGPSTSTEA